MICFIFENVVEQIDFRRFHDVIFYQKSQNVFDLLNFIYLNINRLRNTRRDFEILKIKLEQTFNVFYSKFIKLINQLIDYFEQIKMNCLKSKFTFKFLETMTINEFFIILNVLKKHFFNINNRLNNIRHDEIKKKQ